MSDEDLACRDFVELVTDYLEGALSPRDRARFEAHVAICDGCAEYLEQLRETVRLSGSIPRADLDEATRGALREAFRAWSRDTLRNASAETGTDEHDHRTDDPLAQGP